MGLSSHGARGSKASSSKITKKRLFDFPEDFWSQPEFNQGQDVAAAEQQSTAAAPVAEVPEPAVSDGLYCSTSNLRFATQEELREHYQSDLYRLNLRRKLRNKPPVDEETFERDFDNLSDGSLSGEEDSEDEYEEAIARQREAAARASVRLQFADPTVDAGFIVVYKCTLPDQVSLSSLAGRGSWAVIMSGGGHFSAAVWDAAGRVLKHKSFHRYTTRRKQGGSQAAADSGGKTIKSAGSTLRRFGERMLREEVRELLLSWADELSAVTCVFLRVSKRDKKDLLFSWDDSPLLFHKDNDLCRNVPFPTRRATYKEVTRVYEQLSTVVLSPISLVDSREPVEVDALPKPKANKSSAKPSSKPKEPAEKGTAHLKKRETKIEAEEDAPELDEQLVQLIADIGEDMVGKVEVHLANAPDLKSAQLEMAYFKSHEKLKNVPCNCGLIAIAAACGSLAVLEWLLLNDVPLLVGTSPYLITKAKRVRTFLRRFWAAHPDLHDYKAADIPGPLSDADVAAAAEKDREKRKRDKEKKKERDLLAAKAAAEAAKPPHVRARELRAAAAEARLRGNR